MGARLTSRAIDLTDNRKNVYSQNGDDGIIEQIFATIGERTRWCCEFGAWDGIHLSNTRRLVELGWNAVLIEANPKRHAELVANNEGNPRVTCLRTMVDTGANKLERFLEQAGAEELDLLVIDIDGLDFEIFESLEVLPSVICVEVVPGHRAESRERVPREIAKDAVGQPLGLFWDVAAERGYRLVAYVGNAYFVREDLAGELPALTPEAAFDAYIATLDEAQLRWLAYNNEGHGLGYRFDNPRISFEALGLDRPRFPVKMWVMSALWRINRWRE
jgi:hypothetical protein